MLNKIKDSLQICPCDGMIYLVHKLSDISGFFVSQNHLIYMVYNVEGVTHQSLKTEFLQLNTNIEINSIEKNQQFESGRYNALEILPIEGVYEDVTLSAFINLCVAHTQFMNASSFVKFFYSLVELFQIPKEQKHINLIGLFGELCFLKYSSQMFGLDLSAAWHLSGCKDKYDISLESYNIEIKTTASTEEQVTIKHSQLFNGKKNFLVAVMLEESNGGVSLNKLLSLLQQHPTHFKSFNFALNIERERKRISPTDAENKKFEIKSIKIYNAQEINPFATMPENVSNVTYVLDLEGLPEVNLIDYYERLKFKM